MASIGSFGTAREAVAEELTFDYFGEQYRVHPDATDLALVEFMDLAASIEIGAGGKVTPESIGAGVQSLAAIMSALRELVHPDDFAAVWRAAKANRQTIEDLTELAMGLAAAVADRPTVRPSDSSDGPSSTEQSSTGDSSSPVSHLSVARRFEEQGRPDLALLVRDTAQSRAG